jgi:hypothetical protein
VDSTSESSGLRGRLRCQILKIRILNIIERLAARLGCIFFPSGGLGGTLAAECEPNKSEHDDYEKKPEKEADHRVNRLTSERPDCNILPGLYPAGIFLSANR